MQSWLALAGGLLSACGVVLLVVDARAGVGGWDNVFWQVVGCVLGVSCFVAITRRARRGDHDSAGGRVPYDLGLVLFPFRESSDFGIDRPLLAEVVRFSAVIVVARLLLWRDRNRARHVSPATLDLWLVLVPVFALAFSALRLGSLSAAFAILLVTSIMLRVAGHARMEALEPVLLAVVLLALLVLPHAHLRARAFYSIRQTISARLDAPEKTIAGALMHRRQRNVTLGPSPYALPPRVARQLAIASIVGVAGYPGASAVALLFGLVGWLGIRRVRDAAALDVRVMVAGATATLVVPAALHMFGCLGLLSAHAGPLPFVSYGPGELVLTWAALGLVGGGVRHIPR